MYKTNDEIAFDSHLYEPTQLAQQNSKLQYNQCHWSISVIYM